MADRLWKIVLLGTTLVAIVGPGFAENNRENLQDECNNGTYESCVQLGELEYYNDNTPEAEKLYKRACDGKFYEGCSKLGVLREVEGNADGAKKFYKLACQNEHNASCHYINNLELKRGNKEEAEKYQKIGQMQKSAYTNYRYGSEEIFGMENYSKAEYYLRKACKKKHYPSCAMLGYALEKQGKGEEAYGYYKLACDERQDGSGCYNLGVHEKRKGNIEEAKRLFVIACDENYGNGCAKLAEIAADEGSIRDVEKYRIETCKRKEAEYYE